jgi:hypothetical protein
MGMAGFPGLLNVMIDPILSVIMARKKREARSGAKSRG